MQLQAAIGILAQAADIAGPWHAQWALNSIEPVSWTVADLEKHHLSGQLQLPDGRLVICAMIGICLDHDDDGWLALCIPLEALGRGDPRVGAFPFDDDDSASLTWRRPIDDWFAYLAGEVRAETGFRLAVIGWEASCWFRTEIVGDEFEIREVGITSPFSRDRDRAHALVLTDGSYLPAAC